MHVLLPTLSLFLILLFPYPYRSYPFVSALSKPFLQTCELPLLVQTMAAVPLVPWAADGSANEFSFSNFGISLCTLTNLCFHFSSSNPAPILSKALEIWPFQRLHWECKVVRCGDVCCRYPSQLQTSGESGLKYSLLWTSAEPGP